MEDVKLGKRLAHYPQSQPLFAFSPPLPRRRRVRPLSCSGLAGPGGARLQPLPVDPVGQTDCQIAAEGDPADWNAADLVQSVHEVILTDRETELSK